MSLADDLRNLEGFHQSGALTDAEFAKAKAALLDITPAAAPPRHAAECGLAALLLSMIVLLLFPLGTALMLGALIGAWEVNAVEARHIDFAVFGGYVVVIGLLGLSLVALGCGVWGIVAAAKRRQPFGLAISGTVAGVVAVSAMLVMLQIANLVTEDTRRLFREHPRFNVRK
jgi:hypothetical protein